MTRSFAGTGRLLRFALRRDRIVLPAWALVFLAYTLGGTAAAVALYPDLASRVEAAATVNNMPALVAMYGRIWDPSSPGGVAMMKPIGFGGVFAAILGILLVTRHTRAEEESGRLELVAAQAVGRLAPLASSLLLVAGTMTFLALANGFGVAASGLPSAGAWAFGLSVSLTGMLFAVIAGLSVQITRSARTANVLALCELAVAFLLRGTGDAAGSADSTAWWGWLSPIGWQDQTRAFAGDHFVVLTLFGGALITITPWVFHLANARDFDAGMLPERDGRAVASASLKSVFALALRLQRGLLIGLLITYALMSLLLGAIVSDIRGMLDSPEMVQMIVKLGGSSNLVDAFTAFELSFMAFITATCGVALARRFGVEEQAGRIEPVLATGVSRWRTLGAFLGVALLGTALLQLVLGLGFALANGLQLGTFATLPHTIAAALVYLPAIWVVVAVAFALLAYAPAYAELSWSVVVLSLLISEFGTMYAWPSFVMNLSPFTHVPLMPAQPMRWMPTLALLGAAMAVCGAAFTQYRRRDLATP